MDLLAGVTMTAVRRVPAVATAVAIALAAVSLAGCTAALGFDDLEFDADGGADGGGPGDDGSTDDGSTDDGSTDDGFCGDGMQDPGEACDDGEETADCDDDCTASECGDGNLNETAGEECESPRPASHVTCDECTLGCETDRDDCNDDITNPLGDGCETDLTSPDTCGTCDNECTTDEICFSLMCKMPVDYGYPDASGSTVSAVADTLVAVPVTVPQTTIIALGVVVESSGQNIRMALYADQDGEPGDLVATTEAATLTAGRQEFTLDPPVNIGGDYWLAYIVDGEVTLRAAGGTSLDVKFVGRPFGNPIPEGTAVTWGSGTSLERAVFMVGVP